MKFISRENAKTRVNFILLSSETYNFFRFFRLKSCPFGNFLYNKNYSGVLYQPPKNLSVQVDKTTVFNSSAYCIYEDIVRVGLIVKYSVIICEIIKWEFGSTLSAGVVFTP